VKSGECERSESGIYFEKVCAGENGELRMEELRIKQLTNTPITNIPINGSRSAVCGTRYYEC